MNLGSALSRHALSAALAFAPLAAGPPVLAQPTAVSQSTDELFAREIGRLTSTANWQGALALLDSRPDLANRSDVIRLRAALLQQLNRETEALALLESHLTREPDDALSRFQLGEIHFAKRRDQEASLAYRLADAGQLDPLRAQVVKDRLATIHARRETRFWIGASAAPDSNINSATDASRIDLFGLPFELDDNARRQSGVSFSIFGGAERSFAYAEGSAIRASLLGSYLDAPGGAFDMVSVAVRVGPEWRFDDSAELAIQATASQRWYGGEIFERRHGVFVGGDIGKDMTRWSGSAYFDQIDDALSDSRDGWTTGVDAARTRYLSASTLWRLGLSLAHREAESDTESYATARVSAGLLFPFEWSTMMYVEPYVALRHNYEASFAFGETREDIEAGIAARISKRDWIVAGAYPFISLSAARSESNVSIGEFSRQRVEFGFTREF